MAIITINTDVWVRPVVYAEKTGASKQLVKQWMERGIVTVKEYPELGIKLIKLGGDPREVRSYEKTGKYARKKKLPSSARK